MTRDEALIIAADLVLTETATIENIADEIFKAWSDGYAAGDTDGYANGYPNGHTDGFKDAGRVGE